MTEPRGRRRTKLLVLALLLLLVLGVGGCLVIWLASGLFKMLYADGTRATTIDPDQVATFPSPLTHVEFPAETIEYPLDWPDAYRYPETMRLVELASGKVLAGDAPGWTMKHRFSGDVEDGVRLIESWFADNGWQIVDRLSLDSGGSVLLVQRSGAGNGIITIDSDPLRPGASLIASTFLRP